MVSRGRRRTKNVSVYEKYSLCHASCLSLMVAGRAQGRIRTLTQLETIPAVPESRIQSIWCSVVVLSVRVTFLQTTGQ